MFELEEVLKEVENINDYGKMQAVIRLLKKDSIEIIDSYLNNACFFKVKEGYHIIWCHEKSIRPIKYSDLQMLKKWNKLNREITDDKSFAENAITELEKKYKLKEMLKEKEGQCASWTRRGIKRGGRL